MQALMTLREFMSPAMKSEMDSILPHLKDKEIKLKKKGSWDFVGRLTRLNV